MLEEEPIRIVLYALNHVRQGLVYAESPSWGARIVSLAQRIYTDQEPYL